MPISPAALDDVLDELFVPDAVEGSPPKMWQPIETAPKDGTTIMLFVPHWRQPIQIGYFVHSADMSFGKIIHERKYWNAGQFLINMQDDPDPTHWMPLPEPPTNSSGS